MAKASRAWSAHRTAKLASVYREDTIRQQQMSAAKGDLLTGINAVGLPVFNSNQSIEFCIVALDSEMFYQSILIVKRLKS